MAIVSLLGLLQELYTAVERSRQVNYCNVASITVLAFDWFLTLDMEVSLIWPGKWNETKILYFLTRYSPFIDTSIVLYHQFGYALPVLICKITYQCVAWMFIAGVACAHLILTIRTWAVWERDKRLTYGLPILFVLLWTAGFVDMGIYLRTVQHLESPLPQLFGCIVRGGNEILSVCYILLMVYDACILSLMIIRGISTFRRGDSSQFMRVVYSDGIIYYIYLFSLSFLNAVIILKLPDNYANLLVMIERVIQSVLACRVVLHIRKQGYMQKMILDRNWGITSYHPTLSSVHAITLPTFNQSIDVE